MTVKAKVGRWRHVAFALPTRARRDEVERAVEREAGETLAPRLRLTAFDGLHGLLRTPHTAAADARRALAAAGATPLGTSGTMRGARRHLPPGAAPRGPRR